MSPDPDVGALVPGFLDEATEHLAAIDRDLGELTQTGATEDHVGRDALVRRLLRALHTIKGSASCLGLAEIAELAHEGESLLQRVSGPGGTPDQEGLARLRTTLETLRGACARERRSRSPGPDAEAQETVDALLHRAAELMRLRARTRGHAVRWRVVAPGSVALSRAEAAALRTALLHALNNCVDHAMRSPAARRAAGKPALLGVSIVAERTPGGLRIAISDDGPGIDLAAVDAEARRLGLTDPARAADANPERVLLPGLSTSRAVTTRSGRGLGLDAARAAATGLGGSMEVTTEPGTGTTVTFDVPLLNRAAPSVDTGSESASAA